MAASRIKGITVEIGGDTTKLQTALKGVNSSIRNTQLQLRDVEKLLKLDPGNTELLAQKHRLLANAVSETKEKLATLKTAAEQANTALANGEISRARYDDVLAAITAKEVQSQRLADFIRVMKAQDGIICEFDGRLWGSMAEFVTVGRDKEITVTFRNGTEIQA